MEKSQPFRIPEGKPQSSSYAKELRKRAEERAKIGDKPIAASYTERMAEKEKNEKSVSERCDEIMEKAKDAIQHYTKKYAKKGNIEQGRGKAGKDKVYNTEVKRSPHKGTIQEKERNIVTDRTTYNPKTGNITESTIGQPNLDYKHADSKEKKVKGGYPRTKKEYGYNEAKEKSMNIVDIAKSLMEKSLSDWKKTGRGEISRQENYRGINPSTTTMKLKDRGKTFDLANRKEYTYDPKNQKVHVQKVTDKKRESKTITANAAHEKELKNASISNKCDEIMEKCKTHLIVGETEESVAKKKGKPDKAEGHVFGTSHNDETETLKVDELKEDVSLSMVAEQLLEKSSVLVKDQASRKKIADAVRVVRLARAGMHKEAREVSADTEPKHIHEAARKHNAMIASAYSEKSIDERTVDLIKARHPFHSDKTEAFYGSDKGPTWEYNTKKVKGPTERERTNWSALYGSSRRTKSSTTQEQSGSQGSLYGKKENPKTVHHEMKGPPTKERSVKREENEYDKEKGIIKRKTTLDPNTKKEFTAKREIPISDEKTLRRSIDERTTDMAKSMMAPDLVKKYADFDDEGGSKPSRFAINRAAKQEHEWEMGERDKKEEKVPDMSSDLIAAGAHKIRRYPVKEKSIDDRTTDLHKTYYPPSDKEIAQRQFDKDKEHYRSLPRSVKDKYRNPYNQDAEAINYRATMRRKSPFLRSIISTFQKAHSGTVIGSRAFPIGPGGQVQDLVKDDDEGAE